MPRRFRPSAAVLGALLLITMSVGLVNAGTQGADCPGDATKVRLWENVIGDTGDGNDSYWLCNPDSNLLGNEHTLPGACKGAVLSPNNWNDCVSSISVWVPAGQCFVSYREQDWGQAQDILAGPRNGARVNVVAGTSDTMSSLRWINC